MDSGVPSPIGGDDSLADQQRLLAAPAEARSTYLHSQGAINCPCAWLDKAEGRCRYYEFRPDICRTFEVGGKWCLQHRQLHQIG